MAKSQEEIKEDILSSLEKELDDILFFIENENKKKNSNGTFFFDKDYYKKILKACVNQYPNQGETSIKNFYAWLNHPKNQGNSAVSALLHQQQHLRYSFNFYLERKEKEEFIFFHRVNEIKQKSKQSEFESNLIKNLNQIQGYPEDFSPLPDKEKKSFQELIQYNKDLDVKSTFSRTNSPNLTVTDITNIQIAMIAVKSKISVKWDDSAKQKAELLDIIFKRFLNTEDPKIKIAYLELFIRTAAAHRGVNVKSNFSMFQKDSETTSIQIFRKELAGKLSNSLDAFIFSQIDSVQTKKNSQSLNP